MSSAPTQIRPTVEGHEESMVVRLSRLDHMLELAGEVIIVSSNLNALSRNVREGQAMSHELAEDVKDLAITSNRISSDLHSLVTDVRTVDMGDLFARFRRLARDTSRRLGKAVRFEVEGEDICIDKKTSEKIYDPIAHQIRNAIAHGVEDEAARRAAGKDPVGSVRLVVRNMENATHVQVIDDGRGVDLEAVRAKAVQRGLVDADAAGRLRNDDLLEYLYLPGFSTATTASTTSGRGVGMDVIRTVMNEIGGETRIETERGAGTTFTFVLPRVTAVNISDALLVRAGRTYFAFPVLNVVATQAIPRDQITTTVGRHRSIYFLDKVLPLFDLLEVFGEPPVDSDREQLSVIIVEHKHHHLAFVVSDFLSPQKIVISELDDVVRVPGLTGTAVLSGRQMCMVVDLPRLFELTLGCGYDVSGAGSAGTLDAGDWGMGAAPAEPTPQPPADAPPAPAGEGVDEPPGVLDGAGSEFLQEVDTMLAKANKELLALEESRDNDTADGVFRLMHSIKGNFTMYGAEQPAGVTHKLETLLEQARRGERELTDEVFDALFDGAAYLEEVVRAQLRNERAPEPGPELRSRLDALARADRRAETSAADIDVDAVALDATGEFYLSSRRRDGAALQRLRIEFDPGDQPHFLVAYLILRRIQSVADVLGALPSMSDIEGGLCDGALAVLAAPRDDRPDLMAALEANLKRYFGVSRFDADPYA